MNVLARCALPLALLASTAAYAAPIPLVVDSNGFKVEATSDAPPGTVLHASYVGAALCESSAAFLAYNAAIQNTLARYRNSVPKRGDVLTLELGCIIVPRGTPMTVQPASSTMTLNGMTPKVTIYLDGVSFTGYTMRLNTAEYAGQAFEGLRQMDQWQPKNDAERLAKDAFKLDEGR